MVLDEPMGTKLKGRSHLPNCSHVHWSQLAVENLPIVCLQERLHGSEDALEYSQKDGEKNMTNGAMGWSIEDGIAA